MSTTIDKKVVEMQFNNSNFESNVKTSMNTLEKLKNALNFSGSTKGLEDLNSAVNNVNMSGLGGAVQTVQEKFSALEVIAVTALATITNQAVQAGEQLVAALTVDNIAAGWEKFASKTQSVGTLISQGYDLETVNEQLERLNWYTDETSYNFTDMVSNIAKFTASGQDLETSVTAMEGIANWAALSGQNATTASNAMYQLAQAMSAGYMRLEDYKSIQNASMDTEEFRQKCIDAGVALGTLKDNADGTYTSIVDGATSSTFSLSSFTTSLTKGAWLTSDVMMDVFNEYSSAVDQIYEYAEEKGITASEAIEELGDSVDEFGLKAFKAAQEARTWSDVVDSVKDAASTSWMNIFELFIGNYEQATSLYTNMANSLYDIFIEPLNNLYDVLEGALSNNPFTELAEKIQEVTSPISELESDIESLTSVTKDYGEVVDSIIKGDWGNGQARWDALTEAGYDWAYAQNLVNEKLGDATRHATDYTEATEELTDAEEELSDATAVTIEDLTKMSDAELENLGFTEDQIKALKELAEQAEKTGIPLEDLVNDISQLNGRTLLLNGLKNICESLMSVFSAVGEAWSNVFPATTSEQIYDAIAAFHKFTTYLELSEEQLDKITRTAEGFFSVLKLIKTLIKSGINAAFKVLKSVLSECNVSVLDITSSVGDSLKAFTEWANQNDRLTNAIDKFADMLIDGIKTIKKYVNAFLQLEVVQTAIGWFKELLNTLYDWGITNDGIVKSLTWLGETLIEGAKTVKSYIDTFVQLPVVQSAIEALIEKLKGFKEIGENAIQGLVEGFQNGTLTVKEVIITIAQAILDTFRLILGIHSPSTETYEDGLDFVQGFINGLLDGFSGVTETIKSIGSTILTEFDNIDWSTIYTGALSAALLYFTKKITDIVDSGMSVSEGVGDIFSGFATILKNIGKVVKSFNTYIKAASLETSTEAVKNLAVALGIMVLAILAITLLVDDTNINKLWTAVEIVAALAVILGVLSIALSKLTSSTALVSKQGLSLSSSLPNLIGIAASLLLIAMAVKSLGSLEADELIRGISAMAICVAELIGLVGSMMVLQHTFTGFNSAGIATMCLGVAVALLIMVATVKLAGTLSESDIAIGTYFVKQFLGFLGVLVLITTISSDKKIAEISGMLLAVSVAMMLMVVVAKLAGTLSVEEMEKGALFVGAFLVFLALLMLITNLATDKKLAQVSAFLLAVSASLLIMAAVVKLVDGLSPEAMTKGALFVSAFLVFLAILMLVSHIASEKKIIQISVVLLAVAVSVGILAGIAVLLSLLDPEKLAVGVVAVGILSTFMTLLAAASKLATGSASTLLAMAAAIAVMAVACVALSFVDVEKLAGAVAALSALMVVFGVVINLVRKFDAGTTAILAMTAVIAVLAAALYAVGTLPTGQALVAAEALSLVMAAMAAVMLTIKSINKVSASALATLAVVTAVVAAVAGILYLLVSNIGDQADECLTIAEALSLVLISLAAMCAILAGVGLIAGGALAGVGAFIVVVSYIGTLMAGLGALVTLIPELETFLDKGVTVLAAIGTGIGSFIGSIVGSFLETSTLSKVGTNLSDFITNAGTFFDELKNIDESSANGVKALAETILTLTAANVVEGVTRWFTGGTDFAAFGASLSSLGEGLAAYSDAISGSDIDVEAIKNSAEAALALADLDNNLPRTGGKLQDWIGQKDLTNFATGLTELGTAFSKYNESLSGIDDFEKITDSATAASALADLDNNLPSTGGTLQSWLGQKDLYSFSQNIKFLGSGILNYYTSVKDIDDVEAIKNSAEAAGALATLNNELPNTGGALQEWLFGDKDLGAFGENLKTLGEGLSSYYTALGDGFNAATVTRSANAALVLAELYNNLPVSCDNRFKAWVGSENRDGLTNLEYFATHLRKYQEALGDDFDPAIVESSATAALVLAELNNNLPSTDGVLQAWLGSKDLKTFGSSLQTLGAGLAGYVSSLYSKGNYSNEAIEKSAAAAQLLADLANTLPESNGKLQTWFGGGTMDMATFGTQLTTFGESLGSYCNTISTIDLGKLSSTTIQVQKLVDLGNTITDSSVNTMNGFCQALINLATTGITGFVDTFKNSTETVTLALNTMLLACVGTIDLKKTTFETAGSGLATSLYNGLVAKRDTVTLFFTNTMTACLTNITTRNTSFNTAGVNSMSSLVTGLSSKSESVKSAFTTPIEASITNLRSYYSSFESAGAYLVDGFASGISANSYAAAAQASAMASAAADAARAALEIASPSKVGYEIGDYFGLGFVNAIGDYRDTAYDSSSEMANSAKDGLSTVVSQIADIVSGDLDMEPTIRPVLDLSEVEEEAGKLNTLFSRSQALNVSASIDRATGAEIQNGKNSAGGNTYQFYQTNTSPKALSRTEIYRQTKNQFAGFERMVEA